MISSTRTRAASATTTLLELHSALVSYTQLIIEIIGAFGEVRKCSNRKTGAIRAVKIIRKESLDAKEKVRFFEEIEILRQLDHPNIVRLYEVFQDEKRYYLVTELCTGGELFDEITNRSSFSEQEAALIIK